MSTVIKADEFERLMRPPEQFSFRDLEREAEEILSNARGEATVILDQAAAEGEELKRQVTEQGQRYGHAKGLAQGREEGYAAAREEAVQTFAEKQAQLVETLAAALATFDEDRKRYLAQAQTDLVDLMLAVARRVVKRVGLIDRQVAIENLQEAIEQVGMRDDLRIKVSPDDRESIEIFAEQLAAAEPNWKHVSIVADGAIDPGGCVVKLSQGEVDATLDTQLDQLASLLVPGGTQSR